ncbi:MAG: glycerophosphodiester phosphodiesterase [Gemmiger sp.]|nr:glycerophosphodiester phosphodiesterase [Gemmiger sp.]
MLYCIAILLVLLVLLGAALWAVWPGKAGGTLRQPFLNRNFAHRGLFKQDQSVPENSLPAFEAACRAGYGIELDVQFTSDKAVVVFHDDTLDRMTTAKGWVRDVTLAQLRALPLAGTAETAPTFAETLSTVAGRVPLIIEIKSRHEYSGAYLDELCKATLATLQDYPGDYCIESFDPRVVGRIRKLAPGVLRGQLADSARSYHDEGANWLYAFAMSRCLGNLLGRPQFIAWCPAPRNRYIRLLARLGTMMVYWTALPTDDAAALQRENNAVIFQWYTPLPRW